MITALEWPDVDLLRKTVTVVRSKNVEKRTILLIQKGAFELLTEKAKIDMLTFRCLDSNLSMVYYAINEG